ncbi:lytic murein transglycosylase [Rhodococcus sp. BP-332]|uniref:lytic transglycosylase domain-containing protein n=1 Tax=Rhodococcus sp. BP-332 TaxID=2739447 RepID=UPI001C9B12F7|nr:lytic murein transglycosylase [Rhodococcus sp. BP-332]MBY6677871.1 lytic murein transglycosylase [Rhodococcus sp. BP-332]
MRVGRDSRLGGALSASILLLSAVTLAAGSVTPSSAHGSVAMASAESVAAPTLPPRERAVGLVEPADRQPVAFRSPKPAVAAPAGAPAAAAAPLSAVLVGALGIPELVLQAYRSAEAQLATSTPGCHLPWHLLAAIGRIESGHAGGGRTDAAGTTITSVLGPVLDGRSAADAVITDTDGGALDGDAGHDRAVGPMQFIPATWAGYASDGNGDGRSDPNNVFDAALAAGKYLCSGGLDMTNPAQATTAVLRYNNSAAYTANVLAWSAAYSGGGTPVVGRIGEAAPSPADALAVAAAAAAGGEVTDPSTAAPTTTATTTAMPDTSLTPVTPPPAFGIPGLPPLPVIELPTIPCLLCPPAPMAPPAPPEQDTSVTTP